MNGTHIVRRQPVLIIASVFLLAISASASASPIAQDKGGGAKIDQGDKPEKEQAARARGAAQNGPGAEGARERKGICTERSAVSEFGCAQADGSEREDGIPRATRVAKQSQSTGWWNTGFHLDERQPSPAFGGSASQAAPYLSSEPPGLRKLSLGADDPMAPLPSIAFQTSYAGSIWGVKGTPNQSQAVYRPTIPFSVMGNWNILRMSLPYGATSGSGPGWGTIEVTDLLTVSEKWGRWGAGAAASLGTSGGFGIDAFRAGPALSYVLNRGGWLIGMLNRNTFSKNMALTSLQPVISYHFSGGWSVGAGELQYQIDWNRGGFATAPVGFQIGKVVQHGSQYLRFSAAPQYNVRNVYGASRWSVTIGIAVLWSN
jgi:hypothetical protein